MKLKIYEYKKEYENRDVKKLKYEIEVEDAQVITLVRRVLDKAVIPKE